MTYNRSDIMNAAWVIARRFQGNGEPLAVVLSRALQSAWFTAKGNASVARISKQSTEAQDVLKLSTVENLQSEAVTLENKTRLDHAGQSRLSQLRAAIRASHVADVANVAGGHGRLAVLAVLAGPHPQNAKINRPKFGPVSHPFNPATTHRPILVGAGNAHPCKVWSS